MRKKIIILIGLLAFAAILALILLIPAKPKAGPWKLADGSELSLAGVTYGKKHTMRYGDRVVDYLYPVLTTSLRAKLGCKAVSLNTANSNGIVVWFWNKSDQNRSGNRAISYRVTVADEQGMETEASFDLPNSVTLWRVTNSLEGWVLREFPRRSKEFTIRIYGTGNLAQPVGEFKVRSRAAMEYPVWTPKPLPITVETNGLEVTLASFETGVMDHEVRPSGTRTRTNYSSRAAFTLKENKKRAEADWRVESGAATSASGESRVSFTVWPFNPGHPEKSYSLIYQGTLWTEEPAWKLRVRLTRIRNFPHEELWTVRGVEIPGRSNINELHLKTNIYGSEIELVALSGPGARTSYGATSHVDAHPALHVLSPLPANDTHLVVVGIKNDLGREIGISEESEEPSTGGRGATIRELYESFALTIPENAKTLDITLAYTKSVFVEFVAKPTVAKEATQK